MRAYTELLVKTCHRRGAHAIGGMAAFIPNRRKPEVTEAALAKVAEDKRARGRRRLRRHLGGPPGPGGHGPGRVRRRARRPTQPARAPATRGAGRAGRACSTSTRPPDGITRAGLDTNISVGLRYLASWLSGTGAAAIDDLMEDAATAEISRAQVWQWVHHQVTLAGRHAGDRRSWSASCSTRPSTSWPLTATYDRDVLAQARAVFEQVALADDFPPFLTLPAYELLP